MATYNLTKRQMNVLKALVDGVRSKGLSNTFISMNTMSSSSLIPMSGGASIDLEDSDDMNVIAHTGLVIVQYGSRGTPRYTLTQAAFDAVDQDFVVPDSPSQGIQYIGVQVQGNVGGSIQGIGYANEAEILQIVDDPEALKVEIDKITSALLDAVKNELHGKQLADYAGQLEHLKNSLEARDESAFRKLLSTLSLVNDTTSSLELLAKAWPYMTLLLQFAGLIFK